MALIKPTDPATAQGFRDGILAYLAGPSFGASGDIRTQASVAGQAPIPSQQDLSLGAGTWGHDPQRVFILGLEDLTAGHGTAAAKLAGWRYYAGDAPDKIVVGHVSNRQAPGTWRVTSVAYGKQVWAAWDAARNLETLPNLAAADYELRVLRIPGLHVEVFWLVSKAGGTDLIVMFEAPSQIQDQFASVGQVDRFLEIVVPMAVQRLRYPAPAGS